MTKTASTTVNKSANTGKQSVSKLNKAEIARSIVTAVSADLSIEQKKIRRESIKQIVSQLGCEARMAATYFTNAKSALLSVQERDGTIAERLETGKPVWSVYKIRSAANPVISSFYMFSTKKGAVEANATFRMDGVVKGEQTKNAEPLAA
jgi:hypothetical protein